MAQSLGKKIARIFSVLVASLLLCCAAFLFTACETDHPKIKMTIKFNGDTYELNYKLYRNMYPKTVAHYLELIDLGFFDDTVIHDYSSSYGFYGGAYYVKEGEDDLTLLDYDALELKNISVWADEDKTEALNTLVGEFTSNGYKVENNGLTHVKGSLSTHYYLDSTANKNVYTTLASGAGKQYKYNCTTSQFLISASSNSALNESYCTFGILADSKDEDKFSDLLNAISAFVSKKQDLDEDFSFTYEWQDSVAGNNYVSDYQVTYNVPNYENMIVIKKVEVTKY